jgi:hypothetical protein
MKSSKKGAKQKRLFPFSPAVTEVIEQAKDIMIEQAASDLDALLVRSHKRQARKWAIPTLSTREKKRNAGS